MLTQRQIAVWIKEAFKFVDEITRMDTGMFNRYFGTPKEVSSITTSMLFGMLEEHKEILDGIESTLSKEVMITVLKQYGLSDELKEVMDRLPSAKEAHKRLSDTLINFVNVPQRHQG